jgi:hypothetical protein
MVVLVPDGEGTPTIELTNGSTRKRRALRNRLRPESQRELSTKRLPFRLTMFPFSNPSGKPGLPEIGVLGGGGEVVPVVRFSWIGFEFEPMVTPWAA